MMLLMVMMTTLASVKGCFVGGIYGVLLLSAGRTGPIGSCSIGNISLTVSA